MANKEWLTRGVDGLTFGERLGDLISSRGINQSQLAEQTGIKQSAISEYINGRKNGAEPRSPDCATIIELSKFFGVSTDYLLGRSGVLSADLNVQDIHKMTGLTEENIDSLIKRGPYGELEGPFWAESYEKLTNNLISYASTHRASRTYSRFLANANSHEPPSPKPADDHEHSIVRYKVAAEIISGIPEDGVDYAKGYTVISSKDYSRILLDEFLRDLRDYLQGLYFDSDIGGMDNGND